VAALALLGAVGCGDDEGASGAQQAGGEARPERVTFAASDLAGLEELQRNFAPFQRELSEVLELEVEFFAVPSLNAAVAAMGSGDIDFMLTGPSEYVVLRARELAEPVVGIERPGYRSVIWACRGRDDVRQIEDLRRKEIALSIPGGTSTHLGPSKMLVDAGLQPGEDVELRMIEDPGPASVACERGEVAARGGGDTGYEAFIEEFELARSEFPVIAEGPEFPPDIFVADPDLPDGFVADVRRRILANEDRLVRAILSANAEASAGQPSYTTRYEGASLVDVEDRDYDYMREAFRAIDAEDLTQLPGQ